VSPALKAHFGIEIDFKKSSEAPSRVFRTVSELIEAFDAVDHDLVQSLDVKIEPVMLLEDIESGSVRTWLTYFLGGIDDDALKNLDWKKAVGAYLVKAKYRLIKFLENKTEITDRAEIISLERDLLTLAQDTDIKHIPTYSPIPRPKLIGNLERLSAAAHHLKEGDKLFYATSEGKIPFNLSFKIVPDSIEDLLTKEIITSTIDMILKVKKPDYLGDSMWELKHEQKTIPVKIQDNTWLRRFQNRDIDIRPGDSIRASVEILTKYDYENEVINARYVIKEVIEILPNSPLEQINLIDND
jgi:hypothetical protein